MDLVVYAPIGFALEARRLLPSFVQRGKAQVHMTRTIGEFVVNQGQGQALVQLVKLQSQAQSVLADLGLVSPPADAEPGAVGDATPPSPDEAPTVRAVPAAKAQSGPAAAELAIADYDSLAASQVIPRLDGLTADDLAAVREYETAHRGRRTILGRIAQLEAS